MKNTKRNLVLILITLVVTLTALSACNFGDILKIDIGECQITFSQESYEYTGQAITPDITVKYGDRVLQKDVDYSVEFASNVNVGKGYVKITGIGNFKGEVVKNFDIVESNGGNKYLLYTFYAPNAEIVSGQLSQIVESVDELVEPVIEKRGYKFLYWTNYYGDEVNFEDKDSLPNESAMFYAQFEIITYTIEYVLNGGVNDDANKEEFTVEDIFELKDATRIDKKFVGWYIDEDFDEKLTSLSGVTRDLVLYAKYVDFDYQKTLSYVLPADVNADNYQEQTLYPGTQLTRPAVLSQDKSKKLVWYIDEAMTVRNNLSYMPDSDLTLYARWEDTVYAGFLDKNWYKLSDIKSIKSYEDMVAYVEFILYHNITESTMKSVTYVSGKENIKSEIVKALSESTFPRMISVSYKFENNTCCVYFDTEALKKDLKEDWTTITKSKATLSVTDKVDYYPQIGNVFNNYKSSRSSTFDDFAINHVEQEYECETTDQLFYVLSHGYRPALDSNTTAYRVYKQFKAVMRSICDDRMSDLQKARAIYDWLILNVYYDYNVAGGNLPQANYKYNAFYIEGVLNGAAVCDGLSKAYSVMCAIEGIDCVRVTGKLKDAGVQDAGHAWNKIQLMGQWYLTDATWGNPRLNYDGKSYEYVNEDYFLFTDEKRANVDNYNSDQYTQYVADTQFKYYSCFKMQLEVDVKTGLITTTKTLRTFDLYLDGDTQQNFSAVEEMSYIFEYIDKSGVSLDGMALSIQFSENMSLSKLNEALNMYVSRVGKKNARIERYIAFGNPDDMISANTYKKDSVILIVFSMPQNNYSSQNVA